MFSLEVISLGSKCIACTQGELHRTWPKLFQLLCCETLEHTFLTFGTLSLELRNLLARVRIESSKFSGFL